MLIASLQNAKSNPYRDKVIYQAVYALGQIRDVRAVLPVQDLICDTLLPQYIWEAAVTALGTIGGVEARGALELTRNTCKDEQTRVIINGTLEKMKETPDLCMIMSKGTRRELRLFLGLFLLGLGVFLGLCGWNMFSQGRQSVHEIDRWARVEVLILESRTDTISMHISCIVQNEVEQACSHSRMCNLSVLDRILWRHNARATISLCS